MPPIAILVALADPTRCRIIEILRAGPQPVHLLAGEFDISRPAISRHLRVLKQAGLISEKKIGRENRYALHASRLKPVRTWLEKMALPEKPAPHAAPPAKVETVSALAPKAQVNIERSPKPNPPKAPPVSQMGFDF